jgi:argininosuccinate lyase
MYRSRPQKELDENILKFLSSGTTDLEILIYDILATEAHVIMLNEIGILKTDQLKKILIELESILKNPDSLVLKGEDIHEAIEIHLVEKLGLNIGGRIQVGRSRNDQIATDIRMKARDDLNRLSDDVSKLIQCLLRKSEENFDSIMPLYTHMQQAQIGNFSQYLLAYCEELFRCNERLCLAYKHVNKSPLGSGPVGGSIVKLNRNRTANLLGFEGLIINSIDATTSRDFIVETIAALALIMILISRMCEDLIIWSSQEFGFVELDDKNVSTSSAMPQKKNPDPIELTRAKTALLIGNVVTTMTLLKSLPSGYSRDLQDLKLTFWNSFNVVESSLRILTSIFESLIVRKDVMMEAAHSSYAISLDIAEQLVLMKNIPFRVAHKIVGAIVNYAHKHKIPVNSINIRDLNAIIQDYPSVNSEDIMEILCNVSADKSLQLRSSLGSPNPLDQSELTQVFYGQLGEIRANLADRKENLNTSLKKLSESIINIISE